MTARQRRVARRSRKKRGSILLGLGVFLAAVAIALLSAGIWVLNVAADAPPLEDLKPIDKGANSVVFASDGTRLGVINSDTIRTEVRLARIPKTVRQATIAIEDADFYEHGGVDVGAIMRAALENVEKGQVVQGGSTITQQLVKNLYTGQLDDRDLEDKIQEAKLAEELEKKFSKDEILEQYLNSASYGTNGGRTSIGVEAAARQYFDKPVGRLSLKEAALIAGLPQAPSQHNPLLNPKGAKQRRADVLSAMADQGYISESRAARVADSGLGVNPTKKFDRVKEQYFFDYVTEQLIEEYGPATVRQGGLKVYTTIDLGLQKAARAAIDAKLAGVGPSAAIVTTEAATGNILAMVSNANYEDRKFNLAAQGQRQPGSSFKTMVLTAALRKGVDPDKTLYTSKSPLVIENDLVGRWEVNTFSNSSGGTMNLRKATTSSDNVVFAQLDLDVGPEWVRETAIDMGITSKLNGFPAEGIGGLEFGVTPLEMSNAYSTLASGGVHHDPNSITRVVFPDGSKDVQEEGESERVFGDGVALKVTDILQDNVAAGTGTAARIGCPQAGKTGTTDNFRDAWFVGYTPELSTSVWVGYPDAQIPMLTENGGGPVQGGSFPAQIWGAYMQSAKRDCRSFPPPEEPFQARPFFGEYSKSSYQASRGGSGSATDGTGAVGDDPGAYAPGVQDESDLPGNGNRGNG
jgi:penicillin-binding protein 1A